MQLYFRLDTPNLVGDDCDQLCKHAGDDSLFVAE